MNLDEALEFLLSHQPLPADRELNEVTIQKYDEVRRFFLAKPDVACIRPFLGSFGEGDGLGVYQLVGDVFRRLPRTAVVDALAESLMSRCRSVCYWSAQLAAEFPSAELVRPLLGLLKVDDYDLKYAALTALEQSGSSAVVHEIEEFLSRENDNELRELAQEVVESLEGRI
jgi:hypothetical protein